MRAFLRSQRTALVVLPLLLVLAVAASAQRMVDLWWPFGMNDRVAVGDDGTARFETSVEVQSGRVPLRVAVRHVSTEPSDTVTLSGDEEVPVPPGFDAWRVRVHVTADPAAVLSACQVLLRDTKGREYAAGTRPLADGALDLASCQPSDIENPSGLDMDADRETEPAARVRPRRGLPRAGGDDAGGGPGEPGPPPLRRLAAADRLLTVGRVGGSSSGLLDHELLTVAQAGDDAAEGGGEEAHDDDVAGDLTEDGEDGGQVDDRRALAGADERPDGLVDEGSGLVGEEEGDAEQEHGEEPGHGEESARPRASAPKRSATLRVASAMPRSAQRGMRSRHRRWTVGAARGDELAAEDDGADGEPGDRQHDRLVGVGDELGGLPIRGSGRVRSGDRGSR